MTEKLTGTVKWFNTTKGFGFITVPGKQDIFVHYQDVMTEGFKNLIEGQTVRFEATEGDKGLRASNVEVFE